MARRNDKATPEQLRPYVFHGLDLSWREGDSEATVGCPFCEREGKFSVNIKTGLWRCLVCGEGNNKGGGNVSVFLEKLWEYCDNPILETKLFAMSRKLLFSDTLLNWEVVYSPLRNDWLVPGYTLKGTIGQLYRYAKIENRMALLATPTISHKMHGVNLYNSRGTKVYLCEGPWDAMALWEVLKSYKKTEDGYQLTASSEKCLLSDASVLAVPGCNTFFDSWSKWFADKDVFLCFDNDHERKEPNTKRKIPPAGLNGMKRVSEILSSSSSPPKTIQYVHWGGENGISKDLPHGYDLRDALTKT